MNETITYPVIQAVTNLISFVSVTVGGIFGLYVILVFLKWKESVAVKKMLNKIYTELKKLNKNQPK
jgi:uncharacterized membrane protein YgaE (UPF0421/DUF939 family)